MLKVIPLKSRLKLRDEIKVLSAHHGLKDNLLKDQRSAGSWRKKAHSWQEKRQHLIRYHISGRSIDVDEYVTLVAAAKFMGVTENSIRQRVTSDKPYEKLMSLGPRHAAWNPLYDGVEDFIICRKLNEDEAEEALRRYYVSQQQAQETASA